MFGTVLGGMLAGHPDVPKWKPITAQSSQTDAINANTNSLPALETLASKTNTFNQSELQRMLEASIPGYRQMQEQAGGIINSQLGGEFSESDLRAMRRNEAAYGAISGTTDSGFLANRTLRDLGLGTLQRQQQGLNNAQAWIRNSAALYMPGMFNMTSMFLSPEQTFQMNFQNQMAKYNRDWMKNQLSWGSEFSTLAGKDMVKFDQQVQDTAFSMAGMFAGGGIGGMLGGGGKTAGAGADTFTWSPQNVGFMTATGGTWG